MTNPRNEANAINGIYKLPNFEFKICNIAGKIIALPYIAGSWTPLSYVV